MNPVNYSEAALDYMRLINWAQINQAKRMEAALWQLLAREVGLAQ